MFRRPKHKKALQSAIHSVNLEISTTAQSRLTLQDGLQGGHGRPDLLVVRFCVPCTCTASFPLGS
jgi:hypothetical protein